MNQHGYTDNDTTFTLTAAYKTQWVTDPETGIQEHDYSIVGPLMSIRLGLHVATAEKAREIASTFPKSYRAHGCSVGAQGGDYGSVSFDLSFTPDGTTGGKNETSIKRYAAIRKALAKNGYSVEYAKTYANSYQTEADLDAALASQVAA